MKKKVIKLENSLSLDKETIARLNEEHLGQIEGGQVAGTISCNDIDSQQPGNSCPACTCNAFVGM